MEKQVKFRDRQELQAIDLNSIGDFAQEAIDHVVKDGISDGKAWVDFAVSKSGTAEVTVSPGRVYSNGKVYLAEDPTVFDVLSQLPLVNKKWMAIVGFGTTVDTDTQPRDFLIDALEGTTEPQAVPMQRLRKANINAVYGLEAAQPVRPTIDAANVIIAWVLLGPADVEVIELVTENKLPQVQRNLVAIKELENWRSLISSRVDSLASELAKIFQKLSETSKQYDLTEIASDVARLKELSELEDNYSSYGADRFLTTNESATDNVNFLAKVEEGVRFAADAANTTALQLFNPIDPGVKVTNGLILPTYTEVFNPIVQGYQNAQSISQYTFQTVQAVQKTIARQRIRYGEDTTVCTNSAWWRQGSLAGGIFTRAGETYQVVAVTGKKGKWIRLRRFWYDYYDEVYWENTTLTHTISGSQIAQTFLQAQTKWCTGIGLYFTSKGPSGDVHVLITETEYGMPVLTRSIARVTLPYANIVTSANASEVTKVTLPPTLLEAGKRYGIVILTGGNHFVGMANGTAYSQGTFFVSVDGAYQIGSFERDMMFGLYTAQFPVARREVNLQALSLSGGISFIDLIAPMAVPESCSLSFECQINGVWRALEEVEEGNSILFGLPPLIPFRAVFVGSTDIQPAIDTTTSTILYSRPRTTFRHISRDIVLSAPTQTFKVVVQIENFFETNHDVTATLAFGAMGSEVVPSSITDIEVDPPIDARTINHKNIRRTFVWNNTRITTPQTTFRLTLNGATTSALDTFHIAERVHLSF